MSQNMIDLNPNERERLRDAMRRDREEQLGNLIETGLCAYLPPDRGFHRTAAEILAEHGVTDFNPGSARLVIPWYMLAFDRRER